MTLLTAGALTDPQLPAIASNVYTTDARPGGVDRVPQTKSLATPVGQIRGQHDLLLLLLLPILCRAASSAALSHTGGFRVGGGVHDSYTFQCGLVGSFTSPGIDTR